jgi:hypothetical protein
MGLAQDYPGDKNIKNHADVLLFSDFETDTWGNDWSSGHNLGTLKVVSSDPSFQFDPLSGRALRVTIIKGGNTGISLHYRFAEEIGSEPTEMYFRYYLRFSSQWDPTDGGKLPGFQGTYGVAGWGGAKSDGTNGWSERGAFRKGPPAGNPLHGMVPIGNYSYHADMKDFYGDINDWTRGHRGVLERNRWYSVEQRLKLNTVGKSDGVIQCWVDGLLAHERTGMRWRTVDSLKIESLWMDIYHGGLATMPEDGHLYIDNVVIAKSYIGPMAK